MSLSRYLYTTLHPEIYHGYGVKPPFFEGWYFKLISADHSQRWAVIPGVFKGLDTARDHAFIQVLNGVTGESSYHEYPISSFYAHEERFLIRVGDNTFSSDNIRLNIADEQLTLSGEVRFDQLTPFPVTLTSPGIMGWYGWVWFMECYHGVVSLDHRLNGALTANGQKHDFSGGRGYIEKDWGQAFPSGYVWTQTNHFTLPGTSLSASIATIPFRGRSFTGFIVALWHHGQLYRFATYTGAKTTDLRIDDQHVFWTMRDRRFTLELRAERVSGGLLKAPIRTEMHRRVEETLSATVHVRLTDADGRTIFEDTGRHAGLEVHGELDRLMREL
jgi:hypothetical protein